MRLDFSENGYRVSAQGISVELLPKEYALLLFLYRNRGSAFSREQLLDRVWGFEYPVERTVDDHIYRLRKKLAPFPAISINTIRGFGYSLSARAADPSIDVTPSSQDRELGVKMTEILAKYHRYGQGKSMLALTRQQDVLGYELDPFYSVYVHFVQGDVEWLLRGDLPETDRLYWLLLFQLFAGKPEDSLSYCLRVLDARKLPPAQHREMEWLNILDLYVAAGMPEKALERLEQTLCAISQNPDYVSFQMPAATSGLYARLFLDTDTEELQRMEQSIQESLASEPYLREIGSFSIVSGLGRLKNNERRLGEERIDEGLRVLELSGFVPMQLFGLYRIVHFCRQMDFHGNAEVTRKYEALLADLQARCRLTELLGEIAAKLDASLRG